MVLRGASVHLGVKPQVRERALIRVLIIAVRVLIIAVRVLIIAVRVLIIAVKVLIIAVRVLIIAIRVPILALSRRYVSERCRFLIDPEQFTIVECNLDGIGTPECDERQHSTPGPALPALHQPTGR
jgi:hypothetical protein